MTDEISSMTDRELDKLIAVEVMGLVPCTNEWHKEPSGQFPCYADPLSPAMGGELENYSSDIRDAWQVVERMRELERALKLWDRGNHYCAEFTDCGIPFSWYAPCVTAPRAICEAALQAVRSAHA